ncbi:MAG: hypothetical protein GY747_07545 [Planctomycetes bacterium]|nr:hypothetical protein [Planctomycetota bacterium]
MSEIPADPEQLRVAFAASPENMALLKILVELETKHGFLAEAEALLRSCLRSEEGTWAQSRLAMNFEKQNRAEEAIVLV